MVHQLFYYAHVLEITKTNRWTGKLNYKYQALIPKGWPLLSSAVEEPVIKNTNNWSNWRMIELDRAPIINVRVAMYIPRNTAPRLEKWVINLFPHTANLKQPTLKTCKQGKQSSLTLQTQFDAI